MTAKKTEGDDPTRDLLQDMLIVQLSLAGVSQANIRAIVGCSMDRVNRIGKYLKRKPRTDE